MKRPGSILRYNIEKMRDNGAPAEVISQYLSDNDATLEQVVNMPLPNQNELERILEMEKSGEWAKQHAEAEQKIAELNKRLERLKKITNVLENAQGIARGFGQGLSFGFMDEIESALTGQPVQEIRAEQQQFAEEHPVLNIGSTVVGAVANPTGAIGGAARGATVGEKVVRGALQGAGQGALYGFGAGEDGIENRIASALDSAKTGAIVGGATPVATEGIKAAGRGIANITGLTSGAGGESVKRAFDAGRRNSQTFKTAMRGSNNVFNVVDEADDAIRKMEQARSEAFKKTLPQNGNGIMLPIDDINAAFNNSMNQITGVTRGVDDVAENALKKVQRLAQNVNKAGGLNFNNAMEMKKAIDGIIQPLERAGEKNAVRLIQPIQSALKSTMVKAVPEYSNALSGFSEASQTINAIKKALSMGTNPTTELRALQGITRQSVAAAQGGKQQLGRILDEVSGGKILDEIAGGQVNSWLPRDIMRALGAGGAAISTSALNTNPLALPAVLSFSPRAVGETSFALGRVASKTPQVTPGTIARIVEALRN